VGRKIQAKQVAGTYAGFTATYATSSISISLGATTYVTVTVTPLTAGDSLSLSDLVQASATTRLNQGLLIASARVLSATTVEIGLTSTAALSLVSMNIGLLVVAFR
jgi:hypothetical protein